MKILGVPGSYGIVEGEVLVVDKTMSEINQDTLPIEKIEEQIKVYDKARLEVIQKLETLYDKAVIELGEDEAFIFQGHIALVDDEEVEKDIKQLIVTKHMYADAAVGKYMDENISDMESLEDEYLQERAADFRDIKNHLISSIHGVESSNIGSLEKPVILIAKDLLPSDTMSMDKKNVLGFVTELGGKTSHVCIIAKNLGIPAIVGAEDALTKIKNSEYAILNGNEGYIITNPTKEEIKYAHDKMAKQEAIDEKLSITKHKDTVTLDGEKIQVFGNIGGVEEALMIHSQGAEGIGLLRTEFLYAVNTPNEQKLYDIFREISEIFQNKQVIIRTLDIGGDKLIPGINIGKEENPFLGYRGVRIYDEYSNVISDQIRAALRASADYNNIRLMFPMIISVDEIVKVKKIIEEIKNSLIEEGIRYGDVKIGIMIETPVAVLISDILAKHVDFFSIGSNDLTQYMLAVDRGNEKITELYDTFHPGVLRAIQTVCQNAKDNNVEVGICGEFGSEILAAPLLLAMGFDEISTNSTRVPYIKDILMNIDSRDVQALLEQTLSADNGSDCYNIARNWFENKFGDTYFV